jgi:hypothetical protein
MLILLFPAQKYYPRMLWILENFTPKVKGVACRKLFQFYFTDKANPAIKTTAIEWDIQR